VLEISPGDTLVALKNVTANEAFFNGHFPGVPVMPGVLIIEALAQAGGLLAWEGASASERDWILYLTGVEKARFKLPVRPGDQLILKVKLAQSRSKVWRFESRAEVDGRIAAKAEITMIAGKQS
jgi:3-hydroxyacyl-[acyl-carrier-protein] dehydratase